MMLSKSQKISEEMLKEDQMTPPPGMSFGMASARLSGYSGVVKAQQDVCIEIARELGGDFLENDEAREKMPGCYKYLYAYFIEGVHLKPGEESQIRAGLHLPGCLLTAEPSKILDIERTMWNLAKKECHPDEWHSIV